jgi:hypothetical protein
MKSFNSLSLFGKQNGLLKQAGVLFLYSALGVVSMQAQVTIGADRMPDANAVLDLQSNDKFGFLPPKVSLTSTTSRAPLNEGSVLAEGMIVYNTNAAITGAAAAGKGLYVWNGSAWKHLVQSDTLKTWFYMPSIPVDVSADQTAAVIDLYAEYKRLVIDNTEATTSTSGLVPHTGNATLKSAGAPNLPDIIKTFAAATDLYYYVAGYDESVFTLTSLTADGKLTLNIDADNVTDATYLDIIFVVK